jgi:DNA-directed RNA polymerase subunit K/omega
VIPRPPDMGAFQFVVLAVLRTSQLMRGCRPRVDSDHKATVIAQREVAEGKVTQVANLSVGIGESSLAPVETPSIVVQQT